MSTVRLPEMSSEQALLLRVLPPQKKLDTLIEAAKRFIVASDPSEQRVSLSLPKALYEKIQEEYPQICHYRVDVL